MNVDVREIGAIEEDGVRQCAEIRMQVARGLSVARDVHANVGLASRIDRRRTQRDAIRTRMHDIPRR